MGCTLLLVSGDDWTRQALAQQLGLFGEPAITHARTAKEALALLAHSQFDAILIERDLPDIGGGDLCWLARRHGVRAPMLVLGNDSESGLVLALESGADDYVGRPFGVSVLLARLRAQLRRHAPTDEPAPWLGPFSHSSSASLPPGPGDQAVPRLSGIDNAAISGVAALAPVGAA